MQPFNEQLLKAAINTEMPFGKYAGQKLLTLPEPYLVWFHSKGFPEGKLGEQLALIYEIKLNGLETLLKPLIDGRSSSGKYPQHLPPHSQY